MALLAIKDSQVSADEVYTQPNLLPRDAVLYQR